VTNGVFTEDARHTSAPSKQVWLRDLADLVQWDQGNFESLHYENEISAELKLRKGMTYIVATTGIARKW
jgi:hypothetical protein